MKKPSRTLNSAIRGRSVITWSVIIAVCLATTMATGQYVPAQSDSTRTGESFDASDTLRAECSIIDSSRRGVHFDRPREQLSIQPDIIVPTVQASDRPHLSTSDVWELQMRSPRPVSLFGNGGWRIDLSGGGFGHFGGIAEGFITLGGIIDTVRRIKEVIIGGRVWHHRFPKRINAGRQSLYGFELSGTSRVGWYRSIIPRIGFGQTSLKRIIGNDADEERNLSDITIALTTPSYPVSIGRIGALLDFDRWKLSTDGSGQNDDELTASLTQMTVQYSGLQIGGVWKMALSIDRESVGQPDESVPDDSELTLVKFTTDYQRSNLTHWWNVWVGLSAYSGKAADGEARRGGGFRLGLSGRMPFGGILSVVWKPDVELTSLRSLLDRWYMVNEAGRGGISEVIGHGTVGYERRLMQDQLDMEINLDWLDRRHSIFVIPSGDDWMIATRRLKVFSADLTLSRTFTWDGGHSYPPFNMTQSLLLSAESARTQGFGAGDQAPHRPRAEVVTITSLEWFDYLCESRIVWSSNAPIDFDGELERPARMTWNVAVRRSFPIGKGSGTLNIAAGIDNLLDDHYYDIPGYNEPPLTYYVRIGYGGDFGY